jgi:hypothetical protein
MDQTWTCKKNVISLALLVMMGLNFSLQAQPAISYSFMVAGHAYGAHTGTNIGLHPNFLNALSNGVNPDIRFLVLTGDIVNRSTTESWQQVEQELTARSLPSYYVMGNHDSNATGIAVFNAKHGNTYYSFTHQDELFIVLNSTETLMSISETQIEFLKNTLDAAGDTTENIFIFFHELLWNSHEKYKGVKSNDRSRYDQIKAYSNFWTEVFPILEQHADKKIYVMAGDVGGRPTAIPAFYDTWGNVTLLASGMGEIADENYLVADVYNDETMGFRLIPLNGAITMKEIAFYSVPAPPAQIMGPGMITPGMTEVEYTASEVFNAESYLWSLPEKTHGSSTNHLLSVDFDNDYVSGVMQVKAYSAPFGESAPTTLMVVSDANGLENGNFNPEELKVIVKSSPGFLDFVINSHPGDLLNCSLYDALGRLICTQSGAIDGQTPWSFRVGNLSPHLYLVRVSGTKQTIAKKIMIP